MSSRCRRIFRDRFKLLEPIATDVVPVLPKLESVRAVLLDIYGTLFVSGSGDVGVLREAACEQALAEIPTQLQEERRRLIKSAQEDAERRADQIRQDAERKKDGLSAVIDKCADEIVEELIGIVLPPQPEAAEKGRGTP